MLHLCDSDTKLDFKLKGKQTSLSDKMGGGGSEKHVISK